MYEIIQISLIAFTISNQVQEGGILSFYGKLIDRLPEYLCKPLGGCPYCFTGQFCLWYFIFTKPFDFWQLAFFVSVGIFMALIYNTVWKAMKAICKISEHIFKGLK